MDKTQLLEKVKSGKYSQEQLIGWITALPNSVMKNKPIKNKVGDVMMHEVFKHPYILLKERKGYWVCGLLTSNGDCPEVLEKCNSRFFSESFITKTLFTVEIVHGSLIGIYENSKHLREVHTKLRQILIL